MFVSPAPDGSPERPGPSSRIPALEHHRAGAPDYRDLRARREVEGFQAGCL